MVLFLVLPCTLFVDKLRHNCILLCNAQLMRWATKLNLFLIFYSLIIFNLVLTIIIILVLRKMLLNIFHFNRDLSGQCGAAS